MKKQKQLFAIAAVVIIAVIVLAFFLTREKPAGGIVESTEPQSNTETSQATEATKDPYASTIPTEPVATAAPIKWGDDVTVWETETDPNEVIDRSVDITPDHPEYIDIMGGDPYLCAEGKVYRNNKVVEIEVKDKLNPKNVYQISFGYATGKCNRFLYLNPTVKINGNPAAYFLNFKCSTHPGTVFPLTNAQFDINDFDPTMAYSYTRHYENASIAHYISPNEPGMVWFTQGPAEGPIYVDILVNDFGCRTIASLRMTIGKADDGTYSIVDLDNRDLVLDNSNHPEYTPEAINKALEVAKEAYFDHTIGGFLVASTMTPDEITVDKCIIEYMEPEYGLHFSQFIPRVGWGNTNTNYYSKETGMPILAITICTPGGCSQTMYLQVTIPPTENEPGEYFYVGQDYPLYNSADRLRGYGWQG